MTRNSLPRGGSSAPTNKKYSGAAQSALQTISSYKKSSAKLPQSAPLLLSESALMDKETNAIYWQDVETSNILSTSLTRPYLTQKGVVHVRATILFAVIWLWVWGRVSRWICRRYFEQRQDLAGEDLATAASATSVSILSSLDKLSSSNPILHKILSVLKPTLQFALLTFNALLYLRPPPYPPKLIVATLVLYLLESYGCSTRRYLSHAMNAPKELTEYLERLRKTEPVVRWKVRCFHYEEREFWKSIMSSGGMLRTLFGLVGGFDDEQIDDVEIDRVKPSWMTKKVVTHQAVGSYKFGICEDYTIATLWKRAQSFSSSDEGAPFSKLSLSKLLVLKDRKAREDYFAQQAAFVMLEGRKDVNAEFATSIEVPGFCPKLLAVRPVPHARNISASLFRLHIYYLFTLFGLSLPYRIWFAKHCDEVRVSVVKETSDSATISGDKEESSPGSEAKSSWLLSKIWGTSPPVSSTTTERKKAQELFRKSMQSFSLYEDEPMMDSNLKETGESSTTMPSATDKSMQNNDDTVSTADHDNISTNTHTEPEQYPDKVPYFAEAADAKSISNDKVAATNSTSNTCDGSTVSTTQQPNNK